MFQRTLLFTPTRLSGVTRTLTPTSRYLHASPIVSKTATEKVAEVADKVRTPPILIRDWETPLRLTSIGQQVRRPGTCLCNRDW